MGSVRIRTCNKKPTWIDDDLWEACCDGELHETWRVLRGLDKAKAKWAGEDGWFIGTKFQNLGLEGTEILVKENKGDKLEDLVVANIVHFNSVQWFMKEKLHTRSLPSCEAAFIWHKVHNHTFNIFYIILMSLEPYNFVKCIMGTL